MADGEGEEGWLIGQDEGIAGEEEDFGGRDKGVEVSCIGHPGYKQMI